METIPDIFTTLNCAIDAGGMTQEALTIAIAAIGSEGRSNQRNSGTDFSGRIPHFDEQEMELDGNPAVQACRSAAPWHIRSTRGAA